MKTQKTESNKLINTKTEASHYHVDLCREKLISEVRMLARERGKTPTAKEFASDPRVSSVGSAIYYFGSWNNFLEAAGLKVINLSRRRHSSVSNDELIRQLLMLTEELGRPPSITQFDSDSRTLSSSLAIFRFGSWMKFLEAAGLEYISFRKYTDDDLIRQVQGLAQKLGRTPTIKEFNDDPETASLSTVYIHFGTWNALLNAAGLTVNRYVKKKHCST